MFTCGDCGCHSYKVVWGDQFECTSCYHIQHTISGKREEENRKEQKMKHKILFIVVITLIVLGLLSCGGRREKPIHSQPPAKKVVDTSQRTRVAYGTWSIKYDGCTYLQYYSDVMIHHAVCSNPKHTSK